jgi:cellulose biosynthesis protein BcsQ
MSAAIAFFNNKGGVGKTTLACNFAAYAASQGNRVVILDLDPQCNSTQLVLSDEQWLGIYEDVDVSQSKTVMEPLRFIRAGDSAVDVSNVPFVRSERFQVDLLPGHPSLSILEDILSSSWQEFKAGLAAGARRSAWLRVLRDQLDIEYDVIVIDASPSLGAINRTGLIGADHFVTPMAADLFSLYALDNIAGWLHRWLGEYSKAQQEAVDELRATRYPLIPSVPPIASGFVGYTVQQYVSRASGGEVRRVKAYDRHKDEIPRHAESLSQLSTHSQGFALGTVPNMFSMIPLAQAVHAPIMSLTNSDGLRGAQVSQQERYAEQLEDIFKRIVARLAPAAA